MAINRLAAALILLLAFAFGCTIPQNPQAGLKYFEIVHEKANCPDGGCFTEYLFVSSGVVLKKQYNLPNYIGEPTMELRRMKNGESALFFDTAEKVSDANKNFTGSGDAKNHIFFSDNSNLYSLSFPNNLPAQFLEIFKEAEREFDAASPDVDFYVHQYYQPLTGDSVDFHIFSDGTFIRSVFTSDSNTLKDSKIYLLSENDVTVLANMTGNVTRRTNAQNTGCKADTGLVYGYVEIKQDGKYVGTYTCGNENDGVAALFAFLKNKYG